MSTSLQGITDKARENHRHRFGGLYSWLNETNLVTCFQELRRKAAPGVDGLVYRAYETGLESRVQGLVSRLKSKTYRAQPVRRVYIPKENGKRRALGIPVVEDKLLQKGVAKLLGAIYEQDFLSLSYGYRPNTGPQDCARNLQRELQAGRYRWVVDADIQGFFDNIDHGWILRMLAHRISDGALLRLIGKWLKAGILEESGDIVEPETGTPQGGIVSPILANVYLHYALDLWFEHVVRDMSRGEATMVRYADDFVCAFEYKADAEQFQRALAVRLGKFGLKLATDKTRLLEFSRFKPEGQAFTFLGFEYRWRLSRAGRPTVYRRTAPKRLRAAINRFGAWIKANRSQRLSYLMRVVAAKLQGHWNYYGVRGNSLSLHQYRNQVQLRLFQWLNRRSQRRSYNWERFLQMVRHHELPPPRIMENYRAW